MDLVNFYDIRPESFLFFDVWTPHGAASGRLILNCSTEKTTNQITDCIFNPFCLARHLQSSIFHQVKQFIQHLVFKFKSYAGRANKMAK